MDSHDEENLPKLTNNLQHWKKPFQNKPIALRFLQLHNAFLIQFF